MDPTEIFLVHLNPGVENPILILLEQLFTHKFKVTMASKMSTGKDEHEIQ